MTAGLDVLVQLVMAAITTWLWSTSHVVPSVSVTSVGAEIAGSDPSMGRRGRLMCAVGPLAAGGSLAGNDSADAASRPPSTSARCPRRATRRGVGQRRSDCHEPGDRGTLGTRRVAERDASPAPPVAAVNPSRYVPLAGRTQVGGAGLSCSALELSLASTSRQYRPAKKV